MTPMGLEPDREIWGNVCIAAGAKHGDVLAEVLEVGFLDLSPIRCFVAELVSQPACTVRDRYRQCGLSPRGAERGLLEGRLTFKTYHTAMFRMMGPIGKCCATVVFKQPYPTFECE